MRYKVKELLRVRYNMSEHQINMALIGKGQSLSEAYHEGISPGSVADAIYHEYKSKGYW